LITTVTLLIEEVAVEGEEQAETEEAVEEEVVVAGEGVEGEEEGGVEWVEETKGLLAMTPDR
jgi:hypothetical protein